LYRADFRASRTLSSCASIATNRAPGRRHAAIIPTAPIPLPKLTGLFDTHPRLAAKLFWGFACDAAISAEHVITLGRRSAPERVAHLLLELLTRLQAIGLADERSYRLPLTQEIIGDALGLSMPYVNRVLHQLRDDGLVRIKDQTVIIDNIEELSALADFEHTYLRPQPIAEFMAEHGWPLVPQLATAVPGGNESETFSA
jgi:CRP-like cAMP-binding protein